MELFQRVRRAYRLEPDVAFRELAHRFETHRREFYEAFASLLQRGPVIGARSVELDDRMAERPLFVPRRCDHLMRCAHGGTRGAVSRDPAHALAG